MRQRAWEASAESGIGEESGRIGGQSRGVGAVRARVRWGGLSGAAEDRGLERKPHKNPCADLAIQDPGLLSG